MTDSFVKQIDEVARLCQHLPDDSEVTLTVGAFKTLLVQVEECPKDCGRCHPDGCTCTVRNE